MTNTHEWSRKGVEPLIDSQQQVPIDTFAWWHRQIDRMIWENGVVFIEDVETLPAEAMIALWNREQQPFALALFDIDHFKVVNDTLGHLAGDYVLREFTSILLEHTRAMDVVARFGGEEFVFEGQNIAVTVSAGVAAVGDNGTANPTSETLIGEADNRLYLAKEAGRDCFANASGPSRL